MGNFFLGLIWPESELRNAFQLDNSNVVDYKGGLCFGKPLFAVLREGVSLRTCFSYFLLANIKAGLVY